MPRGFESHPLRRPMRRVPVFDVNETLLDLSALDPLFERVFGDARVRVEWFQTMLQSAFLLTITGPYRKFGEHFRAALDLTAKRRGIEMRPADEEIILRSVRELPAHPDVPGALELLRAKGFRLAALTNSTVEVEAAQLAHAGLAEFFERQLSADVFGRLKPAPEPYRAAARGRWSRRAYTHAPRARGRSGGRLPPGGRPSSPEASRCTRPRSRDRRGRGVQKFSHL